MLLLWLSPLQAASPPAAAIASAHPLATQAGHEILASGGNAFDAAVAITAALAVVEPTGSGLGGGGFWLLHRESDNFDIMIDGRERAPLAAHRDMYLDSGGQVIPGLSVDGPLAAAIPGTPAAIDHLASQYGRLPLTKSLAPAIRLARKGFTIDEHYQRLAKFRLQALRASRSSAKVFLENKEVPSPGFIIKQPDLAKTLETIAKQGKDGFYSGPIAKKLVDGVRKSGGIWSMKDLIEYSVIERPPLQGQYQDIHITATAPPSSGGVALLTMLNILANYHLNDLDSSTQKHLIIETMRRAYRDRAEFLGDPDYVDIPVQRLIHPFYADGLNVSIRLDQATPSSSLPGTPGGDDGAHTTHFSVLDREGNRVAATLTINLPFGSGFMPPGTGILLNDEMDDFSIKSGVPNVYGLIGAHANAIAPGKRPLSSMTPTFLDDGEKIALFGTPGGSRIISMMLLAVLDFAQGGDPASWVSVKRYHHQFMPDAVSYEPNAFSEDEVSRLVALGHILKQRDAPYGNMQAVLWDRKLNKVLAASDPRGNGLAQVR
ncbi:MAG TPA: gamma-glutamyltransferase [Gammaproteobacteria bacterium]